MRGVSAAGVTSAAVLGRSRSVHFARTRAARTRSIDSWWRENRSEVGDLFARELAQARDTIARSPGVGVSYTSRGGRTARRLLLPETRCHVYCRLVDERVRVLAIWSAVRGSGPKL